MRELVKDKPVGLPNDVVKRLDIWEFVNIVEVEPALEECEYTARDRRTYIVHTEVEPTSVARTLEYRDQFGSPIYLIKCSRKDIIRVKKK